ncbi:basic salivary proline-rich protein 3-like [Pygocentrus nattereri]|uniref:basic salivary proline-rich protein 3-like n=1 Tax=Pygocentrus nattereri TaxID=42514 RepID=UPI0018916040|nr:basic salivary proline-rich protein 3-like [Pygocentrus nattereri]
MAILFIVALLFLGANARPNGGWQQGAPMGRPMPGPSGGRWPPGGGRFPSGPVGGGNFPPGPMWPMPGQMEPWRQWDVQGAVDSDEAESFDGKDPFSSWRVDGPLENGEGFGPAGFPLLRFPRHGRPHGDDRRPPPRPGQPHFPPHLPPPRPGGGRPNITFIPLFQANNVTVQNLNVSTFLKAGENVFMLPPTGGRPMPFGYYFKIFYNPNATQTVSFEFGVARIVSDFSNTVIIQK